MGSEEEIKEKKQMDRYKNDYLKCKGCKSVSCRIRWLDYPTLFTQGKLVKIPAKYQSLQLPEKRYSSRCKRCAVGYSIDNYSKRDADSHKGKTLKQLQEDYAILDKESNDIQSAEAYKTVETIDCDSICDKKRIVELEDKLSNIEESSEDNDSLINQLEDSTSRVRELELILKSTYDILFNRKEKLNKKQRECRKTTCVKIRDYYDIKETIETGMPDCELSYDKVLDGHTYVNSPDDWDSECSSLN